MQYKYILFDLDGTLTDPKEGITTSVQYALRALGIEEPDRDKLTPFIGPPLKDSFMKFYGLNEAQTEEAVAKYREWFAPKGIFQNEIYTGVPEMLKALKENGMVLAVASSKPQVFVEKILKHFAIEEYFTVVVGSELDGTRGRKEEVVEEALRQLKGLKPLQTDAVQGKEMGEEPGKESGREPRKESAKVKESKSKGCDTVMVGDRNFDIFGGKRYGLVTVGVTFGYAKEGELEEAGADYVVDTVEELGRLLLQ